MHRALTHIFAVALLAAPCYALAGQEAITTRPDTVGPASDAIRPFQVHITDEALADLRKRILATRWPEKETVADESQGVPLATVRELAGYWATDYDSVAVTVFPGEQDEAPRSWTEKPYPKLIYYHRAAKGGHFAAWEQPHVFAEELRASFRSLR